MPKTINLGLELTDDNSTTFKDWREKINGVGSGENKSNMQIIDEFAGYVNTILGTDVLELQGKVEVVEDRIEAIEDDISSNYYDKTEIDDMIGDIEKLLEDI